MKKALKCHYFLIIMALAGVILSCQKADLSKIENLSGNRIAIIGHGGIGFPSPENNLPASSFSSVVKAIEGYNADGVEIDVQLSADGTLFMYHDEKLETQTDCQGCIYFQDSLELVNCRFRSGFNTNIFLDEYLLPIESVLERFVNRTLKPWVILDVKTSINCPGTFDRNTFEAQLIERIESLLMKYDAIDWCIIESGALSFLQGLKDKIPSAKVSYNRFPVSEYLETALNNDFFMISAPNEQISKADVKMLHEHGLFVSIYNVKVRNAAVEAIEKSPDFIYTDNIILLQEILR